MAERKFKREIYGQKKRMIFRILIFVSLGFFLTALLGSAVFLYYAKDLPRPEKFTEREFVESTKIYDRTGQILLYEMFSEEKREIVPLSEISDYLKKAVISTEDAKFYSHNGIDFTGILRAFKLNWNRGDLSYGGSTISQQLIRSTFLSTQKTAERKTREIILTLELERKYGKDQILEWYLNQIPLGINIYGAESASKTYFNKRAKDLTLAESALLAAVIKMPSHYSPFGKHLDQLLARKDYVLDRMAQENYITKDEAEEAKKEDLKFAQFANTIKAPHFVLEVQDYLIKTYGETSLREGGFKVYTTLDWEMQEEAEKVITDNIERIKKYKAYNTSLAALSPKTGEILAMVGSSDWFSKSYPEGCISGKDCLFEPKVNIATYGIGRQPGSAFKPFAYVTAFQKGHKAEEIVVDEYTDFGVWGNSHYTPQNYDGLFRGPVTLRSALAQSLNIPAVKVLLYLAGLEDTLETAKRAGLTTLGNPASFYGPSIVLGGGEVKLLDMVSAYGVFANDGIKVSPSYILKIEDSKGRIIEQNNKTPRSILDQQAVRMLNSVLSDNTARTPMFGANSSLYIPGWQTAAKTGTTNSYRDAWAIGYTPSICVGVWAGNNDNTPMSEKSSITISGPIWKSFMLKILPKFPKEDFILPEGYANPE
ncbi:MAG: hypothetical protein A2365_00195 [Candidatus Nealsonbacteria bacterium RIFOXYB1_FULL_40_15]|uniref:Uncharacterized protein n=2 Tax=Candidatus Nealsoniibacteriota TaxID=1817911 RepID=A0A1G2ETK6_9BACT|nr:MAG: hypothetical protein A2365_00195 [Candidatus Nealsonbacteria bacterium RIFOXYB1_FULL_40_15]OGZ28721.1 MAG: hypothetical protein A2427_03540 [Candidatus Nealsonbacteria bacterium RIFOXYC1_FULL_40_7]